MSVKVAISTGLTVCILAVGGLIATGTSDTVYTIDTNRRASTVSAEWNAEKVTTIRAIR